MQSIVANVENIRFDLEEQLDSQIGAQPLPFLGMDSKLTIFFAEFGSHAIELKIHDSHGGSKNSLFSYFLYL